MAKVKVDVSRLIISMKSDFNKFVSDRKITDEMGKFLVERIQGDTRRGRPYNNERSFPKLKDPPTPQIRQRLSKYNSTHPAMRPGLSAVTFTGQLMDGLKYQLGRLSVSLGFSGDRKPVVINEKGEVDDSISSNEELAKDLAKRGFVVFTKRGIESDSKLNARLRSIVLQGIRRAFKIRP